MSSIDLELRRFLRFEPNSNKFFRLSIILYELGDLAKSLVYAERFEDYPKGDAKTAMADLIIMLHTLCIEQGWDFDELHRFGLERLKERYREFAERGWKKV